MRPRGKGEKSLLENKEGQKETQTSPLLPRQLLLHTRRSEPLVLKMGRTCVLCGPVPAAWGCWRESKYYGSFYIWSTFFHCHVPSLNYIEKRGAIPHNLRCVFWRVKWKKSLVRTLGVGAGWRNADLTELRLWLFRARGGEVTSRAQHRAQPLAQPFRCLPAGAPGQLLPLGASAHVWIALGNRAWSYPISTRALPRTCSRSVSQGDHLSDVSIEAWWWSAELLGVPEIRDRGQDHA